MLTQRETSNESPTSPLLLRGQEHNSVTVLKGSRSICHEKTLKSIKTKGTRPETKQGASDSTSPTKNRRRNCSWGVIWRKNNADDTGADFRLKNIILKGFSGAPHLKPECLLCRKPYSSDLMYIYCETCKREYSLPIN